MRQRTVMTAALFCMIVGIYAQSRTVPVVRQVDHILIESSDPKALFKFFSETLQLPTAWPVSENNGFVTAGIGAGNVNLELFRYAEQKPNAGPGTPQARYSGLAFEPLPLASTLRELQRRGLPYSPPEPVISSLPNGTRGLAWTTVPLPSLSKPGMSIFLYEYSPAFLRVDVRRKQLANRLLLERGGPLGLISVDQVLLSATNLKKEGENWGLLLGNPAEPWNWRVGAGPGIRLSQGDADGIRQLVLKVSSLDRARTFLKSTRLLGAVSSNGILLNPARVQGLRILIR